MKLMTKERRGTPGKKKICDLVVVEVRMRECRKKVMYSLKGAK